MENNRLTSVSNQKRKKKWVLIILIPLILIVICCITFFLLIKSNFNLANLKEITPTQTLLPSPSPARIIIQSNVLSQALSEEPTPGSMHVFGIIKWGKENISNLTDGPYEVRIGDMTKGESGELVDLQILIDPETSEFVVENVPFGEYGIGVTVPFGPEWPHPGDYQGDIQFKTSETSMNTFTGLILQVNEVIHLKKPINNSKALTDEKSVFNGRQIEFEWEPIATAAKYDVCIYEYIGGGQSQNIECDSTVKPIYAFSNLQPNNGDNYYRVEINAYNEAGTQIGWLMTKGDDWYSWHYSFRVE